MGVRTVDLAQRVPTRPGPATFLKRIFVGRSIASGKAQHALLPKTLAIAVLAPDPLSSVAYSVETMLLVLLAASAGAMRVALPITVGVAALLLVVVASYRQTVRAYVTSGGAYVVAKRNLGTAAALVAASALVIDYILTVAVSVSSGVVAMVSAVPALRSDKILLSVIFVGLLTLLNLRGVRESGLILAGPTFAFIALIVLMIIVGFVKCLGGCPRAVVPEPIPAGALGSVGALVILRAFVHGCAGFTGVEAVSNAVTAFRRPQGRNAAQTLLFIGGVGVAFVLGVSWLAVHVGARPSASVSVLSEVVRAIFPGPLFYVIQVLTLGMLVLAANTSFAGFPRLAAVLAEDRFMPRQFENLGDRLVYSNGVIGLAALAICLIVAFDADVARLVPLYLVGVFTAFTLSQAGMVKHWMTVRRHSTDPPRGWKGSIALNGTGAVATGAVAVVTMITTFAAGAWVVIVALPLLALLLYGIHRHYREVTVRLQPAPGEPARPVASRVVVYVERLDAATARAVGYVRGFRGNDFMAVHVAREDRDPWDLRDQWKQISRSGVELDILPQTSHPAQAVLDYVRDVRTHTEGLVTVVVPEVFGGTSLTTIARSPGTLRLKLKLLGEPRVVTAAVPIVDAAAHEPLPREWLIPSRTDAIVLVSSVNAASLRALAYAQSLQPTNLRALYVALGHDGIGSIQEAWAEYRLPIELDIVDAPFRELGPPILEEVRRVTHEPGAVAAVIVPETLGGRWWQHPLHGRNALFVKRLLLFENRVVLSSVPFRIDERLRSNGH